MVISFSIQNTFLVEQFKLDLLLMLLKALMLLKSAFFVFLAQCQKTALEAEKTTLISLTT